MSHCNEKSVGSDGRLCWVDVAKGIGIILVVFAHVNYTRAILDTIYSFHMPLFFIISGILFNKNKYTSFRMFVKRKLQTLICPYVLFYTLILIYFYVSRYLGSGLSEFNVAVMGEHFLQMFLSQGSAKVISPPLWFVLCLFTVEILYYFISKIDKKVIVVLISAVFVLVGWLFETYIVRKYNILLPWSIDSAMFALGFFTIGNLSADRLNQMVRWILKQDYSYLIGSALAIVGLAVTMILAIPNGHVSLGSKILRNGYVFYITGIVGSLSVLVISALLQKNKFFTYCGRNSFCIMAVHDVIRATYERISESVKFLAYDTTNFIQTILPFVIVLLLSLLVTIIYNKVKGAIINKNIAKHVKA